MSPAPAQLVTDRLLLRRWREADLEPFAAMNTDPAVMEWFPAPLSRDRSDAFAARCATSFDTEGIGYWAIERRDTGEFIGFAGCLWQRFEAPFTPAVDDVFARGIVDQVVSMTAVGNANSRRVMDKLGMTRDPAEDFDHVNVPAGHPLVRHVLYRLRAADRRAMR